MTDKLALCRRRHQKQCEGDHRDGLCTKHRAIWEAMVRDWEDRANAAEPNRVHANAWTAAEDEIVRNNPPKVIAQLLPHRTMIAIGGRRTALGATSTRWTPAEDDIIRNNPLQVACQMLVGRTYKSVASRRRIVGAAHSTRPWTADEDAAIATGTAKEAARRVDRTPTAVFERRRILRIQRNEAS